MSRNYRRGISKPRTKNNPSHLHFFFVCFEQLRKPLLRASKSIKKIVFHTRNFMRPTIKRQFSSYSSLLFWFVTSPLVDKSFISSEISLFLMKAKILFSTEQIKSRLVEWIGKAIRCRYFFLCCENWSENTIVLMILVVRLEYFFFGHLG